MKQQKYSAAKSLSNFKPKYPSNHYEWVID